MRIATSPHSLRTSAIVDSQPGEVIVLVAYTRQLDRLTRAITVKGQAAAGVHDLPLFVLHPTEDESSILTWTRFGYVGIDYSGAAAPTTEQALAEIEGWILGVG